MKDHSDTGRSVTSPADRQARSTANQPRRPGLSAAVAGIAAVLLAVVLPAGAAVAVEPFDLPDQVVDQVGALSGSEDEVAEAVQELREDTGVQLFVAFVDSFSGLSGEDWADESAVVSGMGTNDVLLAVATEDRRFGISVDNDFTLSDAQLQDVEADVEDRLAVDDWAGAVVAAADGYRAALGGSSGGTGGGFPWTLVFVLGLVVIIAFFAIRAGRRTARRAPGGPADPSTRSTAELTGVASSDLVAADDAVRAAEQEVGFAQAQFGFEETKTFAAVVAEGKTRVTEAFTMLQRADDASRPEQERRGDLMAIIQICAQVTAALQEQLDAFAELRDLQANAPEALAACERTVANLRPRVEEAGAEVSRLATAYAPGALASISPNPGLAASLLDAAEQAVATGRQALAGEDRARAVSAIRLAEDAATKAGMLLDAVANARTDLATAAAALPGGIASITSDIADAARLAPGDPAVTAAVAAAEAAVTAARQAGPDSDPLALVNSLTEAEAALDAALGPARSAEETAQRARAQLGEVLNRLGSQIKAVADFIETRRGAVGAQARTELSEAARLAEQARATSDPAQALAVAQQAKVMADRAQASAQRDVSQWENNQRGGGQSRGIDPTALILGTILGQSMGGGRRGGGWGGSTGGFGGSGGRGGGSGGRGGRSGGGSFGGGRRSGGGGGRRSGGGGRF